MRSEVLAETFIEYQKKAAETAIYPGRGSIGGLVYCALKLNGESGEVAEHVGKALRDDAGSITPERREAILRELGDVLWYVANLADELSEPLEAVARRNIKKLQDRKNRGALRGSGDDR